MFCFGLLTVYVSEKEKKLWMKQLGGMGMAQIALAKNYWNLWECYGSNARKQNVTMIQNCKEKKITLY